MKYPYKRRKFTVDDKLEFTESEKKVLKIMFNNMRELLIEGDLVLNNGEYFSSNDLYYLSEKLGIEEYL